MWRLGGLRWRELLARVWHRSVHYELFDRAAQIAYYFLFSVFPLLLFLTTLLGYVVSDPDLRWDFLSYLARVLPSPSVHELLFTTLDEIRLGRGSGQLSLSLLVAVWAASRGMTAVIHALDAELEEPDRGWWKPRLQAIALTLAFAVLSLVALTLLFYGRAFGFGLMNRLHLTFILFPAWDVLRWIFIVAAVSFAFDTVYNFGRRRGAEGARWWTPGAVMAVVLWLGASVGLQAYVTSFNAFSLAYGSLGAVIMLLVWFYITGAAVLLGGIVNTEISRAEAELGLARVGNGRE